MAEPMLHGLFIVIEYPLFILLVLLFTIEPVDDEKNEFTCLVQRQEEKGDPFFCFHVHFPVHCS